MHYPQSIHHRALHQSHERLRISIASEREAEVRSTQQATSFAESKARFEQQLTTFAASSARFEQQLTSNRANDERIRQCLRSRHWTEAEIHTLMSPSIPSSSSAVRSLIIAQLSPGPHDSVDVRPVSWRQRNQRAHG